MLVIFNYSHSRNELYLCFVVPFIYLNISSLLGNFNINSTYVKNYFVFIRKFISVSNFNVLNLQTNNIIKFMKLVQAIKS